MYTVYCSLLFLLLIISDITETHNFAYIEEKKEKEWVYYNDTKKKKYYKEYY